jgi:sphingolipid 4-desaturase/C4-monooxygenase
LSINKLNTPSVLSSGNGRSEVANGDLAAQKQEGYEFEWSYSDEPHCSRRKEMLLKYGKKIRSLYGPDPNTKYVVVVSLMLQVFLAYCCSFLSWPLVFVVAYCLGGLINHSLTLAMHEICHNLAFKSFYLNRLLGIVSNLPLGIPSFVSFKRYHMEHHRYQGEVGVDVDVPTYTEVSVFRGFIMKTIWLFLQPAFYALRPLFIAPKLLTMWEFYNWAGQITFDYCIYHFFGAKGLVYLISSTLLGMGVHPMAAHFVAEHYTFFKGVETYSYYGPLNAISYNVGYHNEHHDFPFIPCSRLPLVRLIAPEYYNDIPRHTSWVNVLVSYIVDPLMGPHRRVRRERLSPEDKAAVFGSTVVSDKSE